MTTKNVHRRREHERLDEALSREDPGYRVIVVEHEPRFGGPAGQIAGEHAGEDVRLFLRTRRDRQAFHERSATSWHDRLDAVTDAGRKRGHISRSRGTRVPSRSLPLKPLSGERRLAVPGRRDEHPDPSLAAVEHAQQTRAFNNPASSEFLLGSALAHS